jgi:uncharacterized cupredoxin-like copper-binding protein
MRRWREALLAASILGLLAAAGPATAWAAARGGAGALARYLHVDAAHHQVTLTLVAGSGGSPFSFDGTTNGRLVVTVQRGWKVHVLFQNRSQMPHSAAVVASASATKPAFPGAATPAPQAGTLPGRSASFTFVAAKAGVYRIACLVPGHEDAGMWAKLVIATHGAPSIR